MHAVVRERLARDLAAGQAPPVGERRQVDRVDPTSLLEDVEHLLHPFVDERDGAHLDADDLVPGRWSVPSRFSLLQVQRGREQAPAGRWTHNLGETTASSSLNRWMSRISWKSPS